MSHIPPEAQSHRTQNFQEVLTLSDRTPFVAGDYNLAHPQEAGGVFVMAYGKRARKRCDRCRSDARRHFQDCKILVGYSSACGNCLLTHHPERCSLRTYFLPFSAVSLLTCMGRSRLPEGARTRCEQISTPISTNSEHVPTRKPRWNQIQPSYNLRRHHYG